MFRLRAILLPLAIATISASAFAQSPDAVAAARAKWDTGARAFRSGDFEAARAAFQAAYDTLPHPELALSLGQVEFRLHKYASAATHLRAALKNPKLKEAERKLSQKSFQQAVTHVGALVVQVDVEGADLEVDGDSVDAGSVGDEPSYLDPGIHVVRAHKAGFAESSQSVAVEAGATTRVTLEMKPRPEPLPPERPSDPAALPHPAVAIESKAPSPAPTSLASTPVPSAPSLDHPPQTERASTGRTVALVTGATLTAISAGFGMYFVVKKGHDEDHATALRDQAGPGGCTSMNGAVPPAGTGLCQSLADAYSPIDQDRTLIGMSFVAAGVFGAATVATLVLWPRRSAATDVRAVVDPLSKTLVIVGSF